MNGRKEWGIMAQRNGLSKKRRRTVIAAEER